MAIGLQSSLLPEVEAPFPVRRFTVDEYHRLAEAGILTADDRVELLEGWITPKMVHDPRHDAVVDHLHHVLRELLPDGWRVRVQSAVATADSEPEPDLVVVRGKAFDYLEKHPTASDMSMVVEVADSSLRRDRLKCPIYARAGIAVYWIVNLVDNQIEVFTSPTGPGERPKYRDNRTCLRGDTLQLIIAGTEVSTLNVGDLLP